MSGDERSAFRRTKRTAVAVGAATLLTFVATAPGSAQAGAPAQEAFNKGTGSAIALGYKVNPTNGNLSFGITAGESVSGHQNTGATGQSRAINLGVIGVTLAGKGCDGGDPTLAAEDQPQPVIVSSGDQGASEGKMEKEAEAITKFARATVDPYAEAITTIAPLGDPAGIYIDGGKTTSHSGVIDGNIREAFARTELGDVVIAGGAVRITGLAWEAVHRSGAVEETLGSFTIGQLIVGGEPVPLPGDATEQLTALKEALAPLGLLVEPPNVRVEEGIVFVDPLKIGIVPNAQRDAFIAPILQGLQPVREALVDALLEIDCGNATYVTVADIVLGSVSGAGALSLELGGVQATTAAIDAFKFASLPPLPALPPTPSLGGVGSVPTPSVGTVGPAVPAATATPSTPSVTEESPIEPIADLTGERGGLMALIAGGGLLLLLGTAEADRRKMRSALRAIPLEA
jgi:hypothetical protein